MGEHALLSASSAERWLVCTAAPRYEEQFPDSSSAYAQHGTIVHKICDLKVKKKFTGLLKPSTFKTELNERLKEEKDFVESWNAQNPDRPLPIVGDKASDFYIEHLNEIYMSYNCKPFVCAETRVDTSEYVPEGYGTCDCVMMCGDTMDVIDFKNGAGVPVSAKGNPQLRLYALGVLRQAPPILEEALYLYPFGSDQVKKVRMTIVQPNAISESGRITSETITVEELRAWGESIKPIAQTAFCGSGAFVQGEHCRFCRGKAQCRARAETNTALEDFKDLLLPTPKNVNQSSNVEQDSALAKNILTFAEIGDLLTRGKHLNKWYSELESFAKDAILKGAEIPGWKVVAGTGKAKFFPDYDTAANVLIAAGYAKEALYRSQPETLKALDELAKGRKNLKAVLGDHLRNEPGAPKLVPQSDKGAPYNSAIADFSGVTQEAKS